jgi:hypothetical protein
MAPEQKALLISGDIDPHQTRQTLYARMAVNLETLRYDQMFNRYP